MSKMVEDVKTASPEGAVRIELALYRIEPLTAATRERGMPANHRWLVRYNCARVNWRRVWGAARTFATEGEALEFARRLEQQGHVAMPGAQHSKTPFRLLRRGFTDDVVRRALALHVAARLYGSRHERPRLEEVQEGLQQALRLYGIDTEKGVPGAAIDAWLELFGEEYEWAFHASEDEGLEWELREVCRKIYRCQATEPARIAGLLAELDGMEGPGWVDSREGAKSAKGEGIDPDFDFDFDSDGEGEG